MLLEVCTVSRKTPLDGKLEVTAATAGRAASLGDAFLVRSDGRSAQGRLTTMSCTCAKADAGGQHEHYFVESELLRALEPGRGVRVDLDESGGMLSIDTTE